MNAANGEPLQRVAQLAQWAGLSENVTAHRLLDLLERRLVSWRADGMHATIPGVSWPDRRGA